MAKQGLANRSPHSENISGIPHCPVCGETLWPPKYTGPIASADGDVSESIFDFDATQPAYHPHCLLDTGQTETSQLKAAANYSKNAAESVDKSDSLLESSDPDPPTSKSSWARNASSK